MKRVILLADDSPAIREVVELAFRDSTIRVDVASSGADAWRRVRVSRPDLVLADAVMPEPDGYELCRRIKASPHPVPVLLISGTFDTFDAAKARECRADGHLREPFDPSALRRSAERLLLRQTPPSAPADESSLLDPEAWSPETLDALSRAVAARLGEQVLRDAVAEILPQIAERVVRERIRQLERLNDIDDGRADEAEGPTAQGA